MRTNQLTALAGLLGLSLIALAAILYVGDGSEGTQRLALLFAFLGIAAPAFVGMVKAQQAADNTNGKLDARIEAAVHRANAARRRGDEPATPDEIEAMDGYTLPIDPGPLVR